MDCLLKLERFSHRLCSRADANKIQGFSAPAQNDGVVLPHTYEKSSLSGGACLAALALVADAAAAE